MTQLDSNPIYQLRRRITNHRRPRSWPVVGILYPDLFFQVQCLWPSAANGEINEQQQQTLWRQQHVLCNNTPF